MIHGYVHKVADVWKRNIVISEWGMHRLDDLVVLLAGCNGHVSRHIDGGHGGHRVSQRNFEGRMLLEFCLKKELWEICGLREGKEESDAQTVNKKKLTASIRKDHWWSLQNMKASQGSFIMCKWHCSVQFGIMLFGKINRCVE